ncbi:unnamed protein product [Enterobius vermicularis]|uniref:UBX domain-containing protein n=1 Tax=Enterobius vermicularis TaxID=51028 RepID=A0A0N4V190_ENTVE|nr:unnamed protein product [Enterobius vermicularis]
MNRLKEFLKKKKVKDNFKKAGPGRKLNDGTVVGTGYTVSPTSSVRREASSTSKGAFLISERVASADFAAQAAYKRMNVGVKQETATQRNIRLKALRELEKEREEADILAGKNEPAKTDYVAQTVDEQSFEHSNVIQNVYFTCELLGEELKLTKYEMRKKVEDFLRLQLDDDALVASSLMIFSLNGEKRQIASETLQKYVQNLIEHPEETKYRRIRMSNKALKDRVLCVKGGLEFLLACGFEEKLESLDNSTPEKFLIITEEKAMDIASLVQALEILRAGEPVPLKLYRDPVVFKASEFVKLTNEDLSPDFFQLSAEELKKEQAAKTLEAERMLMLRTQEMRIRDETLRRYTYKYTVIRTRFPDDFFLQGTFGCYEKLSNVREFVSQHLAQPDLPLFILKDPVSGNNLSDETKTLGELSLAPAAVINFEWDPDVLASYTQQGLQVTVTF